MAKGLLAPRVAHRNELVQHTCMDRLTLVLPRAWLLSACLVAASVTGCSDDDDAGVGAESIYVVPESLNELAGELFFDHPWPSEVRTDGGFPVFQGFPNPRAVQLIDDYVSFTRDLLEGFSPVAPGYLRFSAPLDPTSLPPTPLAAAEPSSAVQLLDIDPASPDFGERQLVSLSFWEPAAVYLPSNTLRFMPTLGFPLRFDTRYALVVTRDVRTASGGAVEPSTHLKQVLGLEPAEGARAAAAAQLADAVSTLADLGLSADRIAHLAVFRTSDPTAELRAVHQHLRSQAQAPQFLAGEWEVLTDHADYDEYRGRYGPSPNYQAGELPFQDVGDGGGFHIVDGEPAVYDTFDLRFSLTVPKSPSCPMPAAGFPIVLYAHGTYGDYLNHLRVADTLAQKCLASMGVDQIFHGDRLPPGSGTANEGLLFFNFENPEAGRTNPLQSALDEVQRARLFTESAATIPASVSTTGDEIRFDGSKVVFMGHSQGGLNGPIYLAIDDSARGAVLSGSGSVFGVMMTQKVEPPPAIPGLVTAILLRLSAEEAQEYDIYHPAISLMQWLTDPADAINYGRFTVREPLSGLTPKSLYMTEGINAQGVGDSYAPPAGIEAQGIALGLPLQLPGVYPIEGLQWGGPEPVEVPPEGLRGNLAGGQASGVFAQWAPPIGSDGHFVMFDVDAATEQACEFLRLLADDAVGTVPAP